MTCDACVDGPPEFVALCFEPSPAHPSDGLPCGRNADRVLYFDDAPPQFACWPHINTMPKRRRRSIDAVLILEPSGRVTKNGATIGYFEPACEHEKCGWQDITVRIKGEGSDAHPRSD